MVTLTQRVIFEKLIQCTDKQRKWLFYRCERLPTQFNNFCVGLIRPLCHSAMAVVCKSSYNTHKYMLENLMRVVCQTFCDRILRTRSHLMVLQPDKLTESSLQ